MTVYTYVIVRLTIKFFYKPMEMYYAFSEKWHGHQLSLSLCTLLISSSFTLTSNDFRFAIPVELILTWKTCTISSRTLLLKLPLAQENTKKLPISLAHVAILRLFCELELCI